MNPPSLSFTYDRERRYGARSLAGAPLVGFDPFRASELVRGWSPRLTDSLRARAVFWSVPRGITKAFGRSQTVSPDFVW